MSNPIQEFIEEKAIRIQSNGLNEELVTAASNFNIASNKALYGKAYYTVSSGYGSNAGNHLGNKA